MKFSVLMSVYYKEQPEYFNRAMQSIWNEQHVKPDEIVLVQDGQLTDSLYLAIGKWKDKLEGILSIVPLEKNVGLGDALNIGLQQCTFAFVARMDTDDIAAPERFEKQLRVFENSDIDICSSWVSEFDNDEKHIVSYRKLPEKHDEIVKYFKLRNSLNHPAVMYKKAIVEKSGGYQKMIGFEDYYLWARMIMNGAKFYNIQESLVNMRAGYGQLERRGGFKYAVLEVEFLNGLKAIGFLNTFEFIRNVSVRFVVRILPKTFLKMIYKLIRN